MEKTQGLLWDLGEGGLRRDSHRQQCACLGWAGPAEGGTLPFLLDREPSHRQAGPHKGMGRPSRLGTALGWYD